MSARVSAVFLKFDNGYNADILAADSDEIVKGYGTVRMFNRAFKPYKKGERFVATFTMGAKGRRTLLTHAPYTASTLPTHFKYRPAITAVAAKSAPAPEPKKEVETVTIPTKTYVPKPKVESNPLDGYYISPEAKMVFNTAHGMSKSNPDRAVKVMMVGPSGFGKTLLPELVAKMTGRSFLRMNCGSIRDPEEWFGYREAKEGSTLFIRSQFIEKMEEGNCVVVLDEFNRIEPWLHNTLYPLLDSAGQTVVHDQLFMIGPNVIICATINTGYRYTGVFELDEALSNRFDFTLEVGPMPHNEEVVVLNKQTGIDKDLAGSLVKTANVLRGENINMSTRSTLEVAKMIVGGLEIREALEFGVIRRIVQDESGGGLRKQAVDLINTRHGAFTLRNMPGDIFGTPGKPKTIEEAVEQVENATTYNIEMKCKDGAIFRYLQFMEFVKHQPLTSLGDSTVLRATKKMADQLQSGQTVQMTLEGELMIAPIVQALESYGIVVTWK